jgi:hypothetical protein
MEDNMLEVIPASELPEHVTLCQDLKEKATHYIRVRYVGRSFYLPVTKSVSRALNLDMNGKIRKKPYDVRSEFKKQVFVNDAIRDVIASLYLQARDNVLDEIESGVTKDVLKRLEEAISVPIRREIEARASEVEGKLLTQVVETSQPKEEPRCK